MIRKFTVSSRARFADVVIRTKQDPNCAEDFMLSMCDNSGDMIYEFGLKWHDFANSARNESWALKVGVFEDAFRAFEDCAELFAYLATQHQKSPQPDDLERFLLATGWIENTEYYPEPLIVKPTLNRKKYKTKELAESVAPLSKTLEETQK